MIAPKGLWKETENKAIVNMLKIAIHNGRYLFYVLALRRLGQTGEVGLNEWLRVT